MLTPSAPATIPMLHRFLGIGVTLLLAIFSWLGTMGIAPLLRDDPETARTIGYAGLATVGVVIASALLVLKPRVPRRTPGQSADQFWATPANAQPAQLVWFALDGAAVTAAITYLLTADVVAWVIAALAAAIFWMNGPQSFANR